MAGDILQQPVRITIGEAGQAAANVKQFVEIMKTEDDKWVGFLALEHPF